MSMDLWGTWIRVFIIKKHNHDKFRKLLNVCIEENKNSLVVKHHKEKYDGKFPIWVIIEFFFDGDAVLFLCGFTIGRPEIYSKRDI